MEQHCQATAWINRACRDISPSQRSLSGTQGIQPGTASPTLSPQSQQGRLQSTTAGRNQGKVLCQPNVTSGFLHSTLQSLRQLPRALKEVLAAQPNPSSWMTILSQLRLPQHGQGSSECCQGAGVLHRDVGEKNSHAEGSARQDGNTWRSHMAQCAPGHPCPCKRGGTRPGWVCFITFLHLAVLPTAVWPYSLPGGCA